MEKISRKQLEQINETLKQVNIPSKEDLRKLAMEENNLFNAISSLQDMIEQALEYPAARVAKIISEAEKHHITVEYNAGIYTVMLDTPFSVKPAFRLKANNFLEGLYEIYDSFSPAQESMKLLAKNNGYFKDTNQIYDMGEVFSILTECKNNLKSFIQELEKKEKKLMNTNSSIMDKESKKDFKQNDIEWLIEEAKKLNIEIDIHFHECEVTIYTPNSQLTFCRKIKFDEGYHFAILQALHFIYNEIVTSSIVFSDINYGDEITQAKNNIKKMIDIVQKRIEEKKEEKKG